MGNRVIYNPAYDAEVEYLESDANSYIDTGLKASSNLGLLAEIQYVSGNTFAFGGADGLTINEYGFMCKGGQGESTFRFGNAAGVEYRLAISNQKLLFDNRTNHNKLYVGGVLYSANYSTFTSTYNFYLFAECRAGDVLIHGSVRIYYFKLYNNDVLIRDFIPVRIGSTGYMYDKVTKQLFANKGTGNFVLGNDVANAVIPQQRCVLYFGSQRSVVYERIYEEYDWLCGRNGAYINTNYHIKAGVDAFDIHFRYDGTMRNPDGNEQDIFGIRDNDSYFVRAYINSANRIGVNYFKLHENDFPSRVQTFDADIQALRVVDNQHFAYSVNGTAYSIDYQWQENKTITPTCYLFYYNSENTGDVGKYFHGDIASFRICENSVDKINMIPCKLLQPIPAILDGNGIARAAGECGMWDKVNDKFYGNVNSSGSFTVSNI